MSIPYSPPAEPQSPVAPYFVVSTTKLAVLSIFSFGFYEIYWFYKHWNCERKRTGEKLLPFWRAVFSIFFAFGLFERISTHTELERVAPLENPGLLGVAFVLLAFATRLPDPYWIVSLFSFVPLLPVQAAANRLQRKTAPDQSRNESYSGANVVLIVIGAILLVLVLLGLFMPAETTDSFQQQTVTA